DYYQYALSTGSRSEFNHHASYNRSYHDAHAGDRAAIAVVVRIEDERAQRSGRFAARSGDPGDDGLEQRVDAHALFGAHEEDLVRIRADQVVHFVLAALWLRPGEVDLVQDRNDLQSRVERE